MNLTNYELLFSAAKVENECGEAFRKNWWDPVFERADRRVFCENAHKSFWATARKLHNVWYSLWVERGRPYGGTLPDKGVDLGMWMAKDADVALLIPSGLPVRYIRDKEDTREDVFGMTLEPTLQVLDGNYSVRQVNVETDKGVCIWPVDKIEPVRVPASMLAFAKAQALRELKCPLMKGA